MRIETPSLPDHWDSVPAKTLFKRVRRLPQEKHGVVTAFRDGEVTLRSNRRTEGFTNAIQEHGYQGVHEGDLVIHSMDGFAGAIGVSDSNGKASPVVHCYRPEDHNDARFYAYLLRHLARSDFITALAKGIRERSTSFDAETFGALVLPRPGESEQRAIADFLDTETARINVLISKKRRLVELIDERRIALTDHAVLAAEATERSVAALGTYINGWPFKPGDFTVEGRPVVRIQQLMDPDAPLDRYDGALPAKVHLSDGDLIFSWSGSLQVRVWDRGPAYLNQHLFRVEPSEGIDCRWLRFALDTATRLFDPYMHGSAMTHITKPMMKEVRLPVPQQQDQLAIAKDLESEWNDLDALSSLITRQIDLLQEHRQALIAATVTGELHVPGVAA